MAKEFFNKTYAEKFSVDFPTRKNFKNLQGEVFGKITVHSWAGIDHKGRNHWWCSCSCDEEKYFKVSPNSLIKGLTKSCGCNYKNNGKTSHESLDSAQDKVDRFLLNTFRGWNKPAEGSCKVCNRTHKKDKAYWFRQNSCCSNTQQDVIEGNLIKLNYTFCPDSKKAICNSCGLETHYSKVHSQCPCKELSCSKHPCAVYVLEESNSICGYKIGKSVNPKERLREINNDCLKFGMKFSIVKEIWLAGEKAAFNLESKFHRYFSRQRVSGLPLFTGSTEVFNVDEQDISTFIMKHEPFISMHKSFPYIKTLSSYEINYSVEWCGFWYPSKKYLLLCEGLTESEWNLVSSCHSRKEARDLISSYRRKRDYQQRTNSSYSKDWGDGLKGSLRQISIRYGHEPANIFYRVNTLGLSMKQALLLPKSNIEYYYFINNKWLEKVSVQKELGLTSACICQRLKKGIPLKYALVKNYNTVNYQGSIFNYNGNCYWWCDLKDLFGEKQSISKIRDKYGTIKDWLLIERFISEEDYFEEVFF